MTFTKDTSRLFEKVIKLYKYLKNEYTIFNNIKKDLNSIKI